MGVSFKELLSFRLLDQIGNEIGERKSHSTAVTFIHVNIYSGKPKEKGWTNVANSKFWIAAV